MTAQAALTVYDGEREALQRYLREVRRYPMLEDDEEHALALAYLDGDLEAGQTLVCAHLRLVARVVTQYRAVRASVQDLLQEGSLGLMRALEKFDPHQGIRFSTYARYWIRARVLRYLMKNHRIVNLASSRDMRRLFFNLNKTRSQLTHAGLEPTERALAEALAVDVHTVRHADRFLNAPAMSLEHPLPGGRTLGGTLAAPDVIDPEAAVARRRLTMVVRAVMEAFEDSLEDERERAIWTERLSAAEPESLADLGRRFGVSRERARQLELRMKKRLRALLLAELGPDIDYEFITVGES